jgi:2-keto-3-deoxy-L-rhamnonate aldolase RhmA
MSLKHRLARQEPLLGTFLKTPSAMICEVLGRTDLDLVCIDAEHAPFDRRDVDACVFALNAVGKSSVVRPPSASHEHILNALDCGAEGVLIPHVATAEAARDAVDAAHYGRGRGYAGSSRAAGYGARTMAEHMAKSRDRTLVIAQIEDAEALEHLDGILGVDGLDACFIGRADLTVSMGAASMDAPEVLAAVERICRAGQAAGRTIGMFTANADEIPRWRALGASLFLLSSDHGFMLAGAAALSARVRASF